MNRRKFGLTVLAVAAFPMPAVATQRIIDKDTSYNVGLDGDFGDLDSAIKWLSRADYRFGANVTLYPRGTFYHDNYIFLGHPNSRYTHIRGEVIDGVPQSRLIFQHGGVQSGLVLNYGDRGGFITGLSLELPEKAPTTRRSSGLLITGGSAGIFGVMDVVNFYYGITVSNGGSAKIKGGVVRRAGDAAYFAFNGASMMLENCMAEEVYDEVEPLGGGAVSENNSVIEAFKLVTRDCKHSGQIAIGESSFKSVNPRSDDNGRYGYEVSRNSSLGVVYGSASGNALGPYGRFGNGDLIIIGGAG